MRSSLRTRPAHGASRAGAGGGEAAGEAVTRLERTAMGGDTSAAIHGPGSVMAFAVDVDGQAAMHEAAAERFVR
ncbi:hypothetical protein HU200_000392 [Digitaria exilis]|uniref:Uncharacterized protein n=1 Tax=Digitaria exilis TaxID=1010633 RepID=A0A835G321_9POAL|nr:hypothetical protein HU200_016098 [Digitaria exilis]KAF8783679.1 hypothetical protein HU200_000392 [Digitaria exilis]